MNASCRCIFLLAYCALGAPVRVPNTMTMDSSHCEGEASLFNPRDLDARRCHHGLAAVVERPYNHGEKGLFLDVGHRYCKRENLHGEVWFSGRATIIRNPRMPGDPVVYWEVRDFFYKLPWSQRSDDLARYIRKPRTQDSLGCFMSLFELDGQLHFKKSQKQVQTMKPADAVPASNAEDSDIEMLGTSAWTIVFLLVLADSNKAHIKTGAMKQLRAFAKLAGRTLPVLESGGHDLPRCGRRPSSCVHVNRVRKRMTQ